MIIEIFGKEDVIKDCLGTLNSLPKGFVPVYFSENEGDFDRENDNWENEEKRNAKRTHDGSQEHDDDHEACRHMYLHLTHASTKHSDK